QASDTIRRRATCSARSRKLPAARLRRPGASSLTCSAALSARPARCASTPACEVASTGYAKNSRQGGGEAACPRSGPVEGSGKPGGFPGKFRKESIETQTRRDHLDPQATDRGVRRGDRPRRG